MKKVRLLLAACGAATLLTSCAAIATPTGAGLLYTDVVAGGTATSNHVGQKVGEAKAVNVLGLVAIGDASIQTAARQAHISKISHVDQQYKSILGIVSSYKVIVYGE